MILNLLMYIVSLIPIFLILFFIYYFDKIEKEPLSLLIKLFIGGCLSVVLIKIMAYFFTMFDPDTFFGDGTGFNGFLQYFTSVGVIEEVSKFIILYIVVWRNKEFNCIFDALVYAVFVSMGFATVENFTYIFVNGTIGTLLLRSLLTMPAHASFGIIMGYFLGNAKYYKISEDYSRSRFYRYCSFFIPMVLHGTYDYLLNLGDTSGKLFLYIYFGYIIILFLFAIWKLIEFYNLKLEFNKPVYNQDQEEVLYSNVAHLEPVKEVVKETSNNIDLLNVKPIDNNQIQNVSQEFNNTISPVENNILEDFNKITPVIDNNNNPNLINNMNTNINVINNDINQNIDLLAKNNSKNTNNNQVNNNLDILFNPPSDGVNINKNSN